MTADNYIIFNNLIIGQTANDHSAEVNMLGRRIELQFILIRLIMRCVSVYYMCALFHTVQMKREEAKDRERSDDSGRVLRNEEEVLKYCFLCRLSSFNTGSESVLLNPPAPWCV